MFNAETGEYAKICPVATSVASATEDSKAFSVKPKSINVDTFIAETEEDVKACLVETSNVFASQDSVEDSVKLVSFYMLSLKTLNLIMTEIRKLFRTGKKL